MVYIQTYVLCTIISCVITMDKLNNMIRQRGQYYEWHQTLIK